MKTPDAILIDLTAGQSTADSIAGRLRVPTLVIEAMLKRHAKDGLVIPGTINDTLIVHRLTTAGIEAASALPRDKRGGKRLASPEPAIPAPIPA